MNFRSLVLALIVILALAVTQGEALKCYQCNSHTQALCNDPFYYPANDSNTGEPVARSGDEFLKECPSDGKDYTLCRKIYQKVRGEESIIRTCGYEEYKYDCYKTVLEEYNTYVCACKGDGCNGSSFLTASFLSIILAALGAYVFGK